MDGQATSCLSFSQDELSPTLLPAPQPTLWPAQRLDAAQRQDLALQVLVGTCSTADLAREHQVSRKFLSQQADRAQEALDRAFAPLPKDEGVLFHLPVTKAWLEQFVLSAVLVAHSSYRGVVTMLDDLFDYPMALGTVHNIVHSAVAQARTINQSYDLSYVRIGAHDEIHQAGLPVLVGVDTFSTFCYLLSLEDHRDADTWGVRLLELAEEGFAPEAIIADAAQGLRCGQALALPEVPCRGDIFHILRDFEQNVTYLENRAYGALGDAEQRREQYERARESKQRKLEKTKQRELEKRERKQQRRKQQGRKQRKLEKRERKQRERGPSLSGAAQRLRRAITASTVAVGLYDDVALLLSWLRHDVLAVAGPCHAVRCELYDFIVAELKSRARLCPHRLEPLCRRLENQRDDLLAFAQVLDEDLQGLGEEFQLRDDVLRQLLEMLTRDEHDPRRWTAHAALQDGLRGRFHDVQTVVAEVLARTVRASSLVENLNSRLRNYFFLRRHLGTDYLALLQFFLNHRPLERSDRPERVGKTPAELLTGQSHPHWLELLGYQRFVRV